MPPANKPFIDNDRLSEKGIALELFPPDYQLPILPPPLMLTDSQENFSRQCKRLPVSTKAEHTRLFLQYNYARKQATTGSVASRPLWANRAAHLREFLVLQNMRLVGKALRVFQRHMTSATDVDALFSAGGLALTRSVEIFNVGKGFRFSTYAFQAILNAFANHCAKVKRFKSQECSFTHNSHDPIILVKDEAETAEAGQIVRDVLNNNAANLTWNEREAIRLRFFGNAMTLEAMGKELGVSKERVRQILKAAQKKLKATLGPIFGEDGDEASNTTAAQRRTSLGDDA